MLPEYTVGQHTVYLRPSPSELEDILTYLTEQYGSERRARTILRKNYRCVLSVNSFWKGKYSLTYSPSDDVEPLPVRQTLMIVMTRCKDTRARKKCGEIIEKLREVYPVGVNPYSISDCFGFYISNKCGSPVCFEEDEYSRLRKPYSVLSSVLSYIKPYTELVAIVNAVWYARVNGYVVFRPLLDSYLAVPTSRFSAVRVTLNDISFTVFRTGKIRITHVLTPEDAVYASKLIHSFLKEKGALVQK